MADRFQKTLRPIDAREVENQPRPLPPDESLSGAIQQVGNFAGEVIRERRIAEVGEELETLGREVASIELGEEVKNASARFKRLRDGARQGAVSDTQVNIEAEAIIKQVTAKNPGFGPEIRQQAASILGFDPTGSQIQSLFGKSGRNRPQTAATKAEKEWEEANTIAGALNLDPRDVFRGMQAAKWSEFQKQEVTNSAALGAAGANEIFSAHSSNINSTMNKFALQMLGNITSGGLNPKDTASVQALFTSHKNEAWGLFISDIQKAGVALNPSDLNSYRTAFNSQFQDIEEMISNGSMSELVSKQSKLLSESMGITAFEMWPDLALMSKISPTVSAEYLKSMSSLTSDRTLQLMERVMPGLRELRSRQGAIQQEMSSTLLRVLGANNGTRAVPSRLSPDNQDRLEEVVSSDIIKNSNQPEVRDRILERTRQRGQHFKDYDQYGQPGARGRATEAEINYISGNFEPDLATLERRLIGMMAESGDITLQRGPGGVQAVQAKPEVSKSNFLGEVNVPPANINEIYRDLKRVQAMDKLINNGWSADVKRDPATFLDQFINRVNTQSEALRATQKETLTNPQSFNVVAPGTTIELPDGRLFFIGENGPEEIA